MAAPYVMSAYLGDATTLNVVMSEMLEEGNSSNPDQYLIQSMTTSGIINVSTVYITANLQNIVRLFTETPHIADTYLLTISGVLNLSKEEIDYNNNTAQYSYLLPNLYLSFISPIGNELYLNGQLKTISWDLATEEPLSIIKYDNTSVQTVSTVFNIGPFNINKSDNVSVQTVPTMTFSGTLNINIFDKILGCTQYEPLLDVNGVQIHDVNGDLIMVLMNNPIITIT